MAPVGPTSVCVVLAVIFAITTSQYIGSTIWDTLETTAPFPVPPGHYPVPLNQTQAEQEGWTVLMDCTAAASVGSPGNVYWYNQDLSAMPVFNNFGQIAGLIQALDDPGQTMHKSPWKRFTLADNTTFWGIQVLFRDPATICNATQASSIEYGDRFLIADGNEGTYSQVPLTESATALADGGWILGGCKDGIFHMGFHWWRYSTPSLDCNDAYPVFMMYDNGILHAYGVAMTNADRPYPTAVRWQHPIGSLLTTFWQPDEIPTCIPAQSNALNAMHVFMSSAVLNNTTPCPVTTTASPETTDDDTPSNAHRNLPAIVIFVVIISALIFV